MGQARFLSLRLSQQICDRHARRSAFEQPCQHPGGIGHGEADALKVALRRHAGNRSGIAAGRDDERIIDDGDLAGDRVARACPSSPTPRRGERPAASACRPARPPRRRASLLPALRPLRGRAPFRVRDSSAEAEVGNARSTTTDGRSANRPRVPGPWTARFAIEHFDGVEFSVRRLLANGRRNRRAVAQAIDVVVVPRPSSSTPMPPHTPCTCGCAACTPLSITVTRTPRPVFESSADSVSSTNPTPQFP